MTAVVCGDTMKWIARIMGRKNHKSTRNQASDEQCRTAQDGGRPVVIKADRPIQLPKDDALGRARLAQLFAEHLMRLDASEGVVVGVLGSWGSGKTSFINLVRTYLKDVGVEVLDFNPWLFSGTNQLVESFFIELSAQLKLRASFSELAKAMENYGEVFSGIGSLPLVGPWIEGVRMTTKILARILDRRKEGIAGPRTRVAKALSALHKPLVVFLDDIDRLTTSEIRDIFKLVRLTANFPNVIYVLAFDRLRVEEALTEQGLRGRDYLEKILQVTVDLPAVPKDILSKRIVKAIEETLLGIDNPGPFDENVWQDVFWDIIRPLVRSMRDVRRYVAALHGTVCALDGQVALADVLALEAVRVFLPDVFYQMCDSVEGLTTAISTYSVREDRPYLKEQIDQMIQAAGEDADVVRRLITILFPAAERHIGGSHYGPEWKKEWLQKRRVAHEEVLRYYLERVAGEGFQAFLDAERALARMADREEFDKYLRSIDPGRLNDVIASLADFEDQFLPEHVEPGTIVLLNLLPELPERQRGILDLPPELIVGGVITRLLRSLKDPDKVEEAVRNILPHVTTLSAKQKLISVVGHRKGAGHKLVSEAAAKKLEEEWRSEVRSASIELLAKERQLLRILLLAKREAEPTERAVVIPHSPAITLALLRSARSEVQSLAMGSRAVRRSPRLAWDALVELYGDEQVLRDRIEELKATQPPSLDEQLLQLAEKYLGGWRPNDFDDD